MGIVVGLWLDFVNIIKQKRALIGAVRVKFTGIIPTSSDEIGMLPLESLFPVSCEP